MIWLIVLIIVVMLVIVLLDYFEQQEPNLRQRWQDEAPEPFNSKFDNSFSTAPPQFVYDNLLDTVKRINQAVSGYGVSVSRLYYGYRDPVTNYTVGGDRKSKHMLGEAFDFDIDGLTPQQMEQLGKRFNAVGLRVIYYPFGKGGNTLHVQQDSNATTKRRIYYARRSNTKSYASTYQEASTT